MQRGIMPSEMMSCAVIARIIVTPKPSRSPVAGLQFGPSGSLVSYLVTIAESPVVPLSAQRVAPHEESDEGERR
eukprot:SAG11_NODE_1800_length_4243_cov_4.590734_5_plen_74_part_00